MKRWPQQQGFTIVELLIVVVVIAILAAITIVAYNGIQDRTRQSTAQQSVATVSKKIQTTVIETQTLPASLAAIGVSDTAAVTYQYTANTSFTPSTYCLTVNSGKYSYHIATGGERTDGPCPNHTGNAPALLNCPAGFITVPGNSLFGTKAFCAMKFEAKNSGGVATSTTAGVPWVSVSHTGAVTAAQGACAGCGMMTLNEWLTIAHNALNVPSNWTGGSVGSGMLMRGSSDGTPSASLAGSTDDDGYSGTSNSIGSGGDQRRTLTLSNGEVIWDFTGNVWEWVNEVTPTGADVEPGLPSDTVGNFVYKQWNAAGLTYGAYAKTAPGYGSQLAAAGNWSSTQGMGQLITSSAQTDARAFIMGGAYTTGGSNTGVFTLRLNYQPAQASTSTGFRATVTP